MRTGPSPCVCRMKRPSNFSEEPNKAASAIASPSSFATGARIIVARQDFVDRGPEPHHAAAQIQRRHLEGKDGVVGGMG